MKFAVSVFAAAALTFATSAQAAEAIIKKFDEATIDKVLAAVGAANIEKEARDGRQIYLFTVNEIKYVAGQQICKPETGCTGFLIQCSFTTDTDSFSTTTINSFNLGHVFTNAAVTDDRKSVFIGRYVVADGGTTLSNTIENMKIFLTMPGLLVTHIKNAGPIASAQPQSTPVSATAPAAAATAASAPAASVATQAAASIAPAGPWFTEASAMNKLPQ